MEAEAKQRAIGYLLLIMAATFWGMNGVMGLSVKDAGVGPLEVAFWRAFIGGGLFIIHALITNNYKVKNKDRLIFMAFGIPVVAILFVLFQVGVREIGMSMTTMLQYTCIVWIMAWGFIFFKEAITKWKIISAGLALCGAIIICLSGGTITQGITFYGLAAALISGFLYSLISPFSKKFMQTYSPIAIYMYTMPFGALCILPFVDFAEKDATTWIWLIGLAIINVWAAYWCYCEGIKRIEISKVGVITSIEPVIVAFIGFAFFNEVFTTMGWIGTGIIILGVILTVKR